MGTAGFPADSFAQQRGISIEQGPSPPLSVSPAGCPKPSASPPVPQDEAKAWEAPVVTVLPISIAGPLTVTIATRRAARRKADNRHHAGGRPG
jgi:hypothetical protein